MGRPTLGYRLKDGTKVPGVTTIIGRFKDSGGLLWWAFEQGQAAERGEINSLYDKRDAAAEAGRGWVGQGHPVSAAAIAHSSSMRCSTSARAFARDADAPMMRCST